MVDDVGREVATVTVGASRDGYGVLLAWAVQQAPGRRVFGRWKAAARTALGCYALLAAGQQVVEAGRSAWDAGRAARRLGRRPPGRPHRPGRRPSRPAAQRRRPGGVAHPAGAPEHANTTRTAAINVFKALLLTAPDQPREPVRRQSTPGRPPRAPH